MASNKALYVSDLDETLLRSDETLSDFTVDTLNRLIESGVTFSYATARSYLTAHEVTKGLSNKLPVIVYNGTFIMENGTQEMLLSNEFSKEDSDTLLRTLKEYGISPMVRIYENGMDRIFYNKHRITRAMQKYLNRRIGDPRLNPIATDDEFPAKKLFCFTCMDDAKKLIPAYESLKGHFRCLYFKDVYTDEYWLEIQPHGATKANAILALKELLQCDRIVCFGNGENDISMFEIADECYAVGNAVDALKAIATAVIDTNDRDGVAKWLLENATK
jgi:Cof subfamily protein (haloacid dehalogenase superfamily)